MCLKQLLFWLIYGSGQQYPVFFLKFLAALLEAKALEWSSSFLYGDFMFYVIGTCILDLPKE